MSGDPSIELLFLGTGTSVGVPMIGCHCTVCSSTDPHDFRMRPSVLVSYSGQTILVDTTPELRLQCVKNQIDMVDAVVYTHAHADHIMGLDDLRRFNLLSGKPLDIWANDSTEISLRKRFDYAFLEPPPEPKVFRPNLRLHRFESSFEIAGVRWTAVPLIHGHGKSTGFRIGQRLAYCTDVSAIPEESYELLAGVELLVLGALSTQKHPSHFTLDEAVAAARRMARQTYFTHIGHMLPHKATNKSLPRDIQLAHDGLRVGLP